MLNAHWKVFSDLQSQANSHILNDRAWAVDEALDALLTDMLTGGTDPEQMRRRFVTLLMNRSKKHRRRRQLWHKLPVERCSIDSLETLYQKERLERTQKQVTPEDWHLLEGIARGSSYKTTSRVTGLTVSNLKSRVSRLRARLRDIVEKDAA